MPYCMPMWFADKGVHGKHMGDLRPRLRVDDGMVMATLGIIGSGNIGSAVARLAIGCGETVVVANSRGPETLGGRARRRPGPVRLGRHG